MKKRFKFWIMSLFFLIGCNNVNQSVDIEKWKTEIKNIEQAFNDMAQKEGLAKAFEFYAAEDGVIKRGKKVINGKEAIKQWYVSDIRPNETLTWVPTFVDVSQSGDLAYTYGDFTFTYPDSLGNEKVNKGIFHTVWKRQLNGEWRFIWD